MRRRLHLTFRWQHSSFDDSYYLQFTIYNLYLKNNNKQNNKQNNSRTNLNSNAEQKR